VSLIDEGDSATAAGGRDPARVGVDGGKGAAATTSNDVLIGEDGSLTCRGEKAAGSLAGSAELCAAGKLKSHVRLALAGPASVVVGSG
jgi:hypothetical protein